MAAMPTPIESRWIQAILGATLVLNLVDLCATIVFVKLGYAEEANPLMAALLDLGPPVFAAVKLAIVSAGVYVLWRYRRFVLARVGSVAVGIAYSLLTLHHARWAETLARAG